MNFTSTTFPPLCADQMNRARFFKLLAFGGDASYEFQPTATSHHSITPFKLTFNLLQHTTHEFDSITNVNKALKKSLQNQFIPAMNYTYTYDDSPITSRRNHLWWQASVTQAGLVLDGIYALAGKKFNKEDKELLGNPFAQFIKGTAEIRYNYALGHKQYRSTIVLALFIATATPVPPLITSNSTSAERIASVLLRSAASVPDVTTRTATTINTLTSTVRVILNSRPTSNTASRSLATCMGLPSSTAATSG